MSEWLWESFLLFLRVFLVLSIIGAIGSIVAGLYAWWEEGSPSAAAMIAFFMVLLGGFVWFGWLW